MLRLLTLLYRSYASLAALLVVFGLFCPLIIIAPTLTLRRQIGRLCVRAALAVALVPMRVRGHEHLPAGPCLVIANHCSYLDGLVLTAALPARFTFVVQDGAANWPYVGLVIRRMGVTFVNRSSARAAATQTRTLIRRLRGGEALAIFPEGTFRAEPGLMPFRRGAFVMATGAQVPLAPAIIRGTRRLFGDGQRLLRHSRVEVSFQPALLPPHPDESALRDLAHDLMAPLTGERIATSSEA
jgi:1-acyl-sn-glycerol-3-phosphate acyltransferase